VGEIQRSRCFYEQALAPLGLAVLLEREGLVGFGDTRLFFFLAAREQTPNVHVAFAAPDRGSGPLRPSAEGRNHLAAEAANARELLVEAGPGRHPQAHDQVIHGEGPVELPDLGDALLGAADDQPFDPVPLEVEIRLGRDRREHRVALGDGSRRSLEVLLAARQVGAGVRPPCLLDLFHAVRDPAVANHDDTQVA